MLVYLLSGTTPTRRKGRIAMDIKVTDFRVRDYKAQPYPTYRSTGNHRIDERDYRFSVREDDKLRHQAPRVYISIKDEGLLDNFANRTSRPHTLWKSIVITELRKRGFTFEKIRWSQKAGCSMCPCSPGFILEGARTAGLGIWITIEADEPQVTDTEEAEHRASQLLADPTITTALQATEPEPKVQPERTFTFADFDLMSS